MAMTQTIARSEFVITSPNAGRSKLGARSASNFGWGDLSGGSSPPPDLLTRQARFAGRPPRVGGGDFQNETSFATALCINVARVRLFARPAGTRPTVRFGLKRPSEHSRRALQKSRSAGLVPDRARLRRLL